MAIRTKKYKTAGRFGRQVRAIKITEKNLTDIVAYICRNGGGATGHMGNTPSRKKARIRLKQRNYGETWQKYDWRVAYIGDYIVIEKWPDYGVVDFCRVKAKDFAEQYEPVK